MNDIAMYVAIGVVALLGLKALGFMLLSRRLAAKDREKRS